MAALADPVASRRAYHRDYQRERRARLRAELERVRSTSTHDRIVARILAIPARPIEPELVEGGDHGASAGRLTSQPPADLHFRCDPCECGGHPECPTCAT